MKQQRIVITGVAGFIGSNLAEFLLARGYEVIGIDNLSHGVITQVPPQVEFHQLDVTAIELEELIRPGDIIFHLAAKNCISDCQADPLKTCYENVYGTVRVLEAASKQAVKKVIYAESSALYEGCKNFPSVEEVVQPLSFYALSKYAAMMFAKGYNQHRNLITTALRYFCVYGPKQDYLRTVPPVMSAFIIKLLRQEQPIIYGDGEKSRDFIHIDDVNDFHLICIEDVRTDNRCFNLGSGESYSVNAIYRKIQAKIGYDMQPIYKEDLPGEAWHTRANTSLAMALGWRAQIDIDTGLQRFIDYYKDTRIPWKISKL